MTKKKSILGKHTVKRQPGYQAERGERTRARLLAILRATPMTSKELSVAAHMNQATARHHIAVMSKSTPKRVYLSGYKASSPGAKPSPVYAVGSLPNELPTCMKRKPKRVVQKRMQILDILEFPHTNEAVAVQMKMSVSRARVYLRELREENQVYIKSYIDPVLQGAHRPVYMKGDLPDAKVQKLSSRTGRVFSKARPSTIFSILGL